MSPNYAVFFEWAQKFGEGQLCGFFSSGLDNLVSAQARDGRRACGGALCRSAIVLSAVIWAGDRVPSEPILAGSPEIAPPRSRRGGGPAPGRGAACTRARQENPYSYRVTQGSFIYSLWLFGYRCARMHILL